jgi:hypothetical protein
MAGNVQHVTQENTSPHKAVPLAQNALQTRFRRAQVIKLKTAAATRVIKGKTVIRARRVVWVNTNRSQGRISAPHVASIHIRPALLQRVKTLALLVLKTQRHRVRAMNWRTVFVLLDLLEIALTAVRNVQLERTQVKHLSALIVKRTNIRRRLEPLTHPPVWIVS